MRRLWTVIAVADVKRSFQWYQSLLGLAETLPAHDYFGQIREEDGTVLLCLHQWGAHDHSSLADPRHAAPGNGLLLFFSQPDRLTAVRGHGRSGFGMKAVHVVSRANPSTSFHRSLEPCKGGSSLKSRV